MKMWEDKRSKAEGLYSRKFLTLYTTGPGIIRDEAGVDSQAFFETVPLEKFGHISNDPPPFPLKKMHKNRHSLWNKDFSPDLEGSGGWIRTLRGRRASIG